MKKSEIVKLVFVSGLLGIAEINTARALSLNNKKTCSNSFQLYATVLNNQDTVITEHPSHGFIFILRGGFGWFGHHTHSGS